MLVVLGREPAHEELALLVRVGRELDVVDLVAALGLLVAVGDGRVVAAARLVEHVPVDAGRVPPSVPPQPPAATARASQPPQRHAVRAVLPLSPEGYLPFSRGHSIRLSTAPACAASSAAAGGARAPSRAPVAGRGGSGRGSPAVLIAITCPSRARTRAPPATFVEQLEAIAELRRRAISARWSESGEAGSSRCAATFRVAGSTGEPRLTGGEAAARLAPTASGGGGGRARRGRTRLARARRQPDLVALVDERQPRQRQQQHRRRARVLRPEAVGRRGKSWFDMRPGRARSARGRRSIAARSASASHGAWKSSNANAPSRCSRYGPHARPACRPLRPAERRRRPRAASRAPRRCRARCLTSSARAAPPPRAAAARTARSRAGRRAARRPSGAGRSRRRGSRRRRGRARTGRRPRSPRGRPGCASRGPAAPGRTSAGTSARARAYVHAGPPKAPTQLFGGSRPSAQMYRSGCSRNHGCSTDVWQGTRSSRTRSPRAWAAPTSASRSASVPNAGSTAVKSLTS